MKITQHVQQQVRQGGQMRRSLHLPSQVISARTMADNSAGAVGVAVTESGRSTTGSRRQSLLRRSALPAAALFNDATPSRLVEKPAEAIKINMAIRKCHSLPVIIPPKNKQAFKV